ncbi:MAG: hypothetical protein KBD53_04935 [Candidatus Omnitrophica bacterium]|nr:hypothetical protein [Candidatus Omnitrophota bacterium]
MKIKNFLLVMIMVGLIGVLPVEAAKNPGPLFKRSVSYKPENKKVDPKKEPEVYSPQNSSDPAAADKENERADPGENSKNKKKSDVYLDEKNSSDAKIKRKHEKALEYKKTKSVDDYNRSGKVNSFRPNRINDEAVDAGFETKALESKPFGPELMYKRFEEKDKKKSHK